MKNRKQTSTRIAELAGNALADERSSKEAKALAGSALAQAHKASHVKPHSKATAA